MKPGTHPPVFGIFYIPYFQLLTTERTFCIGRQGYTDRAVRLQEFVEKHGIKALNVAGSRESKEPGIWQWACKVIDDALFWGETHPNMLGGPGEG